MSDPHPPTLAAAQARIAAFRPGAYARTRNAIDGAVSGLSPYITHGLVSLTDVLTGVAARHELDVQHKFVYELGWRAYFRHVWQQRGKDILQSLHRGPLPDSAYATELPPDIRHGHTGVPAIDQAVRTLYATGLLRNHARMWLASYVVHLRKVHWRCGADWFYGHLLDGDLASNHLSWQWVAGTGSHKPYLFNAANVARYAPAPWHSPGSVIDASYEELDRLARQPSSAPPGPAQGLQAMGPPLLAEPPEDLGAVAPDPALVQGREVWLVHPWNLSALPPLPPDTLVLGVFVTDFHRAWPWSDMRWRFVGTRMAELTPHRWHAGAVTMGAALAGARRVRCVDEPHLAPWLARWAECVAAPALFPPVAGRCDSFSQWWARTSRGLQSAADLLAVNEVPAW
jgi:deoxyribodipyrimidine photo-lyase